MIERKIDNSKAGKRSKITPQFWQISLTFGIKNLNRKIWVKSGEPLPRQYTQRSIHCLSRAIPSEAVQETGTERVTTRGRAKAVMPPRAPKPANQRVRYSLICIVMGQNAELGHKQAKDNKHDSGYDTLDVSASDVLSAAKYDWKQAAVHVSASGLELRQNAGKNQLINLAKSRLKNAMNTFKNNISSDIYSDGTATNQINGLQALVADAGTGTVGGINSSTYAFWQNIVQSAAAPLQGGAGITPSASTIKSLMNPLWLALKRGNDAPDLIMAGATYFEYFWDSLQDLQRYASADNATAGFQMLKYVTADVVHDGASWGKYSGGLSDTRMYFLNTEYLGMTVHKDANMTEVPEQRSVNQDAVVIPIIHQFNLTCSNRSLQGIVKA